MNRDLKPVERRQRRVLLWDEAEPCWAGSVRSRRDMLGCLLRWVHIIQVLGLRNLYKHKQEIHKSLEVNE